MKICFISLTLFLFLLSTVYSEKKINFDREIQPILSDLCFHCHGPDSKNREANLRLDTFEGATAKRKRRAAIVPGKAMESDLILKMISDDEDEVMPPPKSHKVVTPEIIERLKTWINQGAEYSQHWAFIAPKSPSLPKAEPTWVKNSIDRFVHHKLTTLKLKPNVEADKRTLLRRVSLDLTGLPPSETELNNFLKDEDPKAYEKQVERLLNSKHYGERMAWPWLDAARYSDTNGYQGDRTRDMWPWRDWVIKAFNNNMSFDQFTIEQIAGDLLPNATFNQKLATAFLRNHMLNGEGGRIAEENRVEYVFDQLETVGTAFLGLTFNCCRCHDHKYDPLSQKDYYAFSAFFNQTPLTGKEKSGRDAPFIQISPTKEVLNKHQKSIDLVKQNMKHLREKLFQNYQPSSENVDQKKEKDKLLADHKGYQKLKKDLQQKNKSLDAQYTKIMVMKDDQERKTYILNSGLYNQRGEEVKANTPEALPPLPKGIKRDRLALAKWIVSEENPLTSRVIMNRIWAQIFGVGLIKTTENFGLQGERPHNQELLDWLAHEFIKSKWDLKHMIRLMVTSATYRQCSKVSTQKQDLDPYNRHLARGARFRMPSWMIRDQALFASGLMNRDLGGKGVHPYQPSGIWADMSFGKIKYQQDNGDKLYKRSLYTFWRRIVSPTMFFDIAKRQICEVKDKRTNTPLHALVTMNDITYVEAGRALAIQAMEEKSDPERIQKMMNLLLSRDATQQEMKILQMRLNKFNTNYRNNPQLAKDYLKVGEHPTPEPMNNYKLAALANIGLLLLNLDESLTKE